IEYILSRGLLPQLSAHVLSVLAEGGQVGGIEVSIGTDGRFRFAPVGGGAGGGEDGLQGVEASAGEMAPA
ncbi:hypothetical protein AB4144_21675, partial [Rhizobiaceae sp. 2RAB30]